MRGICYLLALAQVIAVSAAEVWGQRAPSLPASEGEKIAKQLIAETLAQKPEVASTNFGSLNIRDADGQLTTLAVRFETFEMPKGWTSVYTTAASPKRPVIKLSVVHLSREPPVVFAVAVPFLL